MCGKQRWSLMVLETLDTLGPTESLGAFEQTSGDLPAVNHGTLYPAPLKLEQEGYISSQGLATGLAASFANLAKPTRCTLVYVTLTLLAVAAGACWVPARRALRSDVFVMRLDPMVALRYE
jgi:hypothetical protein